MTERMIQLFDTPDEAHRVFERTSLDDLKKAIYSLPIEQFLQTRTYNPINRSTGLSGKGKFSTIAEIAAAPDSKVLELNQFGPKNLEILNEALIQIARGYGMDI
jgi:hypothetical protein